MSKEREREKVYDIKKMRNERKKIRERIRELIIKKIIEKNSVLQQL